MIAKTECLPVDYVLVATLPVNWVSDSITTW